MNYVFSKKKYYILQNFSTPLATNLLQISQIILWDLFINSMLTLPEGQPFFLCLIFILKLIPEYVFGFNLKKYLTIQKFKIFLRNSSKNNWFWEIHSYSFPKQHYKFFREVHQELFTKSYFWNVSSLRFFRGILLENPRYAFASEINISSGKGIRGTTIITITGKGLESKPREES